MQAFTKALAFLLLAALAAAPVAGLDFYPRAAAYQQPARCHLSTDREGGGNVPAHTPTSHSCCQGAHHPAILPQNSTAQPSLEASVQGESSPDAVTAAAFDFLPSFTAPPSLPLLSPLRL
jgi:hypothetical protein